MWKKILLGSSIIALGGVAYLAFPPPMSKATLPSHLIAYKEMQCTGKKERELYNEINSGLKAKFFTHYDEDRLGGYSIHYDQSLSLKEESKYRVAVGVYVSDQLSTDQEVLDALKEANLNIKKIDPSEVLEIIRKPQQKGPSRSRIIIDSHMLINKYIEDNKKQLNVMEDMIPPIGIIMLNDKTKIFVPSPESVKNLPESTIPRPGISRMEMRRLKKLLNKKD